MTAVAEIGFETEAIRHIVSAEAGTWFSTFANPSPPIQDIFPSSTIATAMPGAPHSARVCRMIRSAAWWRASAKAVLQSKAMNTPDNSVWEVLMAGVEPAQFRAAAKTKRHLPGPASPDVERPRTPDAASVRLPSRDQRPLACRRLEHRTLKPVH